MGFSNGIQQVALNIALRVHLLGTTGGQVIAKPSNRLQADVGMYKCVDFRV